MPAVLATLLYEDRRGPTNRFPFHDLLVACVSDKTGFALPDLLRKFEGRPLKGNAKVRAAVRDDAAKIASDGRRLIAVFDNDKVRSLYGLDGNAPRDAVVAAIQQECAVRDRLRVVLLRDRLESVIEAAKRCDPSIPDEQFRRAVERKDRLARDTIFSRIAWKADRSPRDCILEAMPELRAVRDELCILLESSP